MYLDILQALILFFEAQDVYLLYQNALSALKGAKKRALKKPAPPTLDDVFFGVRLSFSTLHLSMTDAS